MTYNMIDLFLNDIVRLGLEWSFWFQILIASNCGFVLIEIVAASTRFKKMTRAKSRIFWRKQLDTSVEMVKIY